MTRSDSFVHLHLHSEYSLLDGLPRINEIVKKVKELGMPAAALTDHGNMYGAIEFYQAAKAAGIKPILGSEVYMAAGSRSHRKRQDAFHLTLLAKDYRGYQNLMKIVSAGWLEGFYYKPRIDFEVLKKYHQGIIVLSGCGSSLLSRLLGQGKVAKARELVERFLDIFGDDYYLEIQRHANDKAAASLPANSVIRRRLIESHEYEVKVEKQILKLSQEYGIPLVATNDVHYLEPEHAKVQDVLICIQTGRKIEEVNRLRMVDNPDYYLKSPTQMRQQFADLPAAVDNSLKIADQVNIEIALGKWFFPKFNLPKGKSAGQVLTEKVLAGAKKLYGDPVPKKVMDRIKYEIDIIDAKGYSAYFLIVQDMVLFAKRNNIITNTRGSAAGSVAGYCLGISSVDPLKFQLPFERFLNPYRPLPPDIDLDVSDVDRERIINYLIQKYGRDKEAQICTFGRMLARAAVRDVGRVLGYPYAVPDKIAKLIPFGSQGFPITIRQALEISPALKSEYDNNPEAKEILDLAQHIEGHARHISVHAAAVVVAPTQITDFTPIQYDPGGESIITQYEMHAAEAVGLIKFDLLGVTNLSILGESIKLVKKRHQPDFDISKVPLNDKHTFEILSQGKTVGIFQLSSPGMTHYLKQLQPQSIFDIMAMVALYRPGPMNFIPEFIKRRHNPKLIKYFDPRLKEILKLSYGIITYQDDVLLTAIALAGYDWLDADKFRKAIGKKIPAEMKKQKEKFINGCIKNGMSKTKAEELFKMIEPFAGYGFNKAHAASYALIAYQTAYMKAHYPLEFMAPLLTAFSDNSEKLAMAVNEAKKMGITILPPDINRSYNEFVIEKQADGKEVIRFGLKAIKNVGHTAIEEIVDKREKGGPFLNIVDFIRRINSRVINRRVLESLIKAGVFDSFTTRATLIENFNEIYRLSLARSRFDASQGSLFGDSFQQTIKVNLPEKPEYPMDKILAFEKEVFGFYLSGHPFMEVFKKLRRHYPSTISEIKQKVKEALSGHSLKLKLAANVAKIKYLTTKSSRQQMAVAILEDETGILEALIFPQVFAKYHEVLREQAIFVFEGVIDTSDERKQGSLIVNKITPVKHSSQKMMVNIKVEQGVSNETIKKLRLLLESHPGENPVTIWLADNGHYNKVVLPFKVEWDQALKDEIINLLGEAAVK